MTERIGGYGELVLSALAAAPDRIAFVQDDAHLSYAGLARRIGQFGSVLTDLGCRGGDAAGFLATNKPDVFAAMMACALLGVRYTPLHPLGSAEDHEFILKDAEIDLLLFDASKFGELGLTLSQSVSRLKHVLSFGKKGSFEDIAALADRAAAFSFKRIVAPEDTLAVAYTGGTTGRPKGAVLSHRSVVSAMGLVCDHWQWPQDIRILLSTPISHAAGAMIVPTLLKGGTVFLQEAFAPKNTLEAIQRHQVTTLFLVPTMIYALLDEVVLGEYDTSSLESIFYGAAPMAKTRLREATKRFGPIFMQLYGQVESSVALTILRKEDHADEHKLLSCGRPLAPENLKILDETQQEVPAHVVGEICVKGPTIMDGYWRRPDETEAVFEGGWLHTGDLAKRDDDGLFYIVDRAKDMIVSGGFNVFPREIEDVLCAHESVNVAAAIGVPHEKWGEAVHALVVKRAGSEVTAAELIELVREKKGPAYAPKSVEFVEFLPLTALGKVDKKSVRASYWRGHERLVG